MKRLLLASIIGMMLFISPALALDINMSTNKAQVLYGENFTLTGKITFDNGTAGVFDYRASAVAPEKVVICDSGRKTTAADGSFSLFCKVPTKDEANSLRIKASSDRTVIPIRPGVAVLDPEKFEVTKKHARTVLAMDPDRFKVRLRVISTDLDRFIKAASVTVAECEKIVDRSRRFNVTNVTEKCRGVSGNANRLIGDVANLSARIKMLVDNLNASSLEDIKDGLSIITDDVKSLRTEIKDARDLVRAVKWDDIEKQQRNRGSADRTRLRAELLNASGKDFGNADFEKRTDRIKFKFEVEDMQFLGFAVGDSVCAQVNGVRAGCVTLAMSNATRGGLFGELELDSRRGEAVSGVKPDDTVTVTDKNGNTILTGRFGGGVGLGDIDDDNEVRGREDELRGRANEPGEDVRENELRGRVNEPGEDVRGQENEIRGRENEPAHRSLDDRIKELREKTRGKG